MRIKIPVLRSECREFNSSASDEIMPRSKSQHAQRKPEKPTVSSACVTLHFVYSEEVFKALNKRCQGQKGQQLLELPPQLVSRRHSKQKPIACHQNSTSFSVDLENLDKLESELQEFPAHVRQVVTGKLDKPTLLRPPSTQQENGESKTDENCEDNE